MPISKEQARGIAEVFHDASHALGTYRFDNWGDLSAAQRQQLENAQWSLLNYSSDFVTTAVGIALDDLDSTIADLKKATDAGMKVINTIKDVKSVIDVAGDLVTLGGAIASQNPSAILSAISDVYTAAKNILNA